MSSVIKLMDDDLLAQGVTDEKKRKEIILGYLEKEQVRLTQLAREEEEALQKQQQH